MCEHDAENFNVINIHNDSCEVTVSSTQSTGSRRRRLWDLPHQCHCSVVGVCLPLDALKRLINKALYQHKVLADDYELHLGAVAECTQRNRLSELMQTELDSRYIPEIQLFKAAKTTNAVAQLWASTANTSNVAGAFWAALTHPRCDDVLQEVLCRDMHMLQHQVGASARIEIEKFNALLNENAILARELAKVQARSTRLLAEKSREAERLQLELMQMRAELAGKDCRIVFLSENLIKLKSATPDFDAGERLQKIVAQKKVRQSELEKQNLELRQKLRTTTKSLETFQQVVAHAARTQLAQQTEIHAAPITLHLNHKTVLCVGGRSGSIANYRDVIEKVGGRFAHHDGGIEDRSNILDASLAAADLVICQTGCISHNAYWKVKDFCKRTGKRCVFVENPSVSSLTRGLEQITTNDLNTNSLKHEVLVSSNEKIQSVIVSNS
ncbi:hypothetical protein HC248_02452 [Polaromonas vacuolata]|uniref:DUF2325 domain-containing protein n=1 Tax=Polaromonas vacuolata TaxID=37448 RepID=A0A6H2HCE0_9BURK|nr:hypothetical protein HC248_02452 [Polaromonas vacuolata]